MDTISFESEWAQRGRQIYRSLYALLTAIPENIGKIVAIDPHTGDYAIDADLLKAIAHLRQTHPNADPWSERIGYSAVYSFGGSSFRVDEHCQPILR